MKSLIYKIYIKFVLFCFGILRGLRLIEFYQPMPQLKISLRKKGQERRVLARWNAMEKALPDDIQNAMDIGCNVGFYAFSLAQRGYFVTGIEGGPVYHIFSHHAKEALGLNNVSLAKLLVTPDNVKTLPGADCVLLLAVFHHWCRAFGKESALEMLDEIYRKTGKVLFFETGEGGENYAKSLPDMGDSPENWIRELFLSKGCNEVKVISDPENGRTLVAVYKP
ncbi:MAG: SAM-dependent methyltransferase [Verrucomicrobiales bacterium]|jgi:SAM-dependent methyltransferase